MGVKSYSREHEANNMETWEVNLHDTRNHMLVGDTGEAIALHYLGNQGFFLVARPIRFRVHGEITLVSAHYQKQREIYRHFLTDEQKEYLNSFPSWDYVAFKKQCDFYSVVQDGKVHKRDWRNPYLVEVKTVGGERNPHKKPKSDSISRAQTVGFKPILLIVRLLNNWNIFVEARDL